MTEQEAYAFVESRLWPNGPACPRCGPGRARPLAGKSTRIGAYKCYGCRKPFNVKVGTVFESSHIPMRSWLAALAMLKEGASARKIGAALGITHGAAWRMVCRLQGSEWLNG